jgi:hypothetical protein
MSFLSPWFLLGALAVAGPIVFHLIRHWARDRTPFSSLMFLLPTPPRVARRRKLEHIWLLLLRCLCLVLLATAFARPFVAKDRGIPPSATEGCQRVLLVDTSASMRRESLWNEARRSAERYLDKASADDQVALLTFDRQPRTLVSFREWSAWPEHQRAALARQRLAAVSPGWMGTHLGLALTSAAEQFVPDSLNSRLTSRRELIVITDLQEGSELEGLQGFDWPRGVHVIVVRVDPQRRTNAGAQILADSTGIAGQPAAIHARVTNARDSRVETFHLHWAAENGAAIAGEPMEIYLPPGQTRTFTAPPKPPGMKSGALRLTGDDAEFDNVSYFAAPEREEVRIAYFGSESANDPAKLRYYLERVFNDSPQRRVRLSPIRTDPPSASGELGRADRPVGPDAQQRVPTASKNSLSHPLGEGRGEGRPLGATTSTSAEMSAEDLPALDRAAFAVIPASLAPEEIKATREWLTRGKTALVVLTDTQMGPTLAALLDLPEVRLTEVARDYALLGEVDFTHPVFAPFAESRFSDFTRIHFWKYRRWDALSGQPARVLAKFDDGSPALVEMPVGQGRLLVLTSGWDPADSQLALASKFPPLMETMLDWSGAGAPKRRQFFTGDVIPSPVSSGTTVEWHKPDGTTERLAANVPFADTDSPGAYVAAYADQEQRFAVNLPAQETRTAPLSPDELMRLGVPLQINEANPVVQTGERQRHLRLEELENRQKLWRGLIAGALAVAFGETLLSGWLARRLKTTAVTGG